MLQVPHKLVDLYQMSPGHLLPEAKALSLLRHKTSPH